MAGHSVDEMLEVVTRLKNCLEDKEVGLGSWHMMIGSILRELTPYVDSANGRTSIPKSQ